MKKIKRLLENEETFSDFILEIGEAIETGNIVACDEVMLSYGIELDYLEDVLDYFCCC